MNDSSPDGPGAGSHVASKRPGGGGVGAPEGQSPESRLQFAMRSLGALRACTGLLVEPSSEAELLARFCPTILQAGGFSLAWIGLAQDDADKTVCAVASAGAVGYLADLRVTWGDEETGRGPTGQAIRTGQPSVVNEVTEAPHFGPWRAAAAQFGFHSSIAIPFAVDGTRASLNLYDVEPAAFGPEETAVLIELSQILAYGLTARRTAERLQATTEARLLSERRLLAAQRIAHVGCWEWDPATDTAFWTDEVYEIIGNDPAQGPLGLADFAAVSAPEDFPLIVEAIQGALEDRAPFDHQHMIIRPDGARRVVHFRGEVARDQAGRPTLLVGTIQDVTDMAAAQAEIARGDAHLAQAKELDRLKSAFLNDVTHELRSPLTALMGYAELIEELCDDLGPQPRDLLARLQRQIDRLRHLVDELLDAASLEAGTFRLRLERTALAPIIEDVVAGFQPRADAAGLTLALQLAPELPPVRLDANRMEQVLTNLIDNALKFTPPGGTITLEARSSGAGIRISLHDTGEGIAAEDLPRVFERFTRVGDSYRKQGTGLGLTITKALVEAHGGHIEVESLQGSGATFIITLPQTNEPEAG